VSDPALLRKVVVHSLRIGGELPCDGKIYRESDGGLSIGLRYDPKLERYHSWVLSRIALSEKWRAK
jgi:hypothetical protein